MQTTPPNTIETNRKLQAEVIAAQNDMFRRALVNPGIRRKCYDEGITGNLVLSHNVAARPPDFLRTAIEAVAAFSTFNADNDPHGDHSFGVITVEGCRLFWKIDLYDLELDFGSERAYDPTVTERILTVLEPTEY